MRHIFLLIFLTILFTSAFSQQNVDTIKDNIIRKSSALKQLGQNEIRLNVAYAIFGLPEINYEMYLADNMGIGIACAYSFEKVEDMRLRYQAMPFARLYFGEKKASGFFIEANMGMIGQQYKGLNYDNAGVARDSVRKSFTVGFGAAAGAKFLARNGFIGEVYLGMGRLLGNSITYAYPRIGICLGKRF